ncbi:MAG TPA: GyrI-like domain-containing protein [Longimicrobium sp.]|jgi:effector-binding domain-containing protein
MIDTPQITQTEARNAAIIRLTVPRQEIRNVMGPAMSELKSAVAAQGVTPDGPMFTHHLRMDPDTFDLEVGMAVPVAIAESGRVRAGGLPAATVARTTYRGGYEGLSGAWGELHAWMRANGHEPGADLWESYVSGPEADADPANWRTELTQPLAR